MDPYPREFFARDTLEVARDLIGARLVRDHPDGGQLVGRIVETEAYTQDDPAFHGWNLYNADTDAVQQDRRGADLFEAPGQGYVYLIYGMHWLLNVVTEPEGTGGAVLVRAVEPLRGLAFMREQRAAAQRDRDLTNGPGKLAEAFDVDDAFHRTDLTTPPLHFVEGCVEDEEVVATSSRIGISEGTERPWRFFIQDHSFVSPATPSGKRSRE